MATKSLVSVANKSSKVITPSGFSNYDVCINPYVGCEFGCTYCYVRFFVKDDQKEWGEFVRVRTFIEDKLPKELKTDYIRLPAGKIKKYDENGEAVTKKTYRSIAIPDARLVIGTMTDPYQPQEKKHRITRTTLQILLREDLPHFKKVGIFTRSPLVLQDIDLIKKLPNARVHFTITPYNDKITRLIEPYSPVTSRRWSVIKSLKEAGIRVHVNVAPVMPTISEEFIDDFARKLAELQVDEYFVDPMQAYKESFESFKRACVNAGVEWDPIESVMLNKRRYTEWKLDYFEKWNESRKKYEHLAPNQLPIWSDHETRVWVDMRTGEQMNRKGYGEG
jgi:DNA repair photolyase